MAKRSSLPNVAVRAGTQTTEITGDGSKVNGLSFKDHASGAEHTVVLEGVLVKSASCPTPNGSSARRS